MSTSRRRVGRRGVTAQPAHTGVLLSRPLISYLRKFYYYDPEEEIHPSLKERGAEPSSQPAVQPQT